MPVTCCGISPICKNGCFVTRFEINKILTFDLVSGKTIACINCLNQKVDFFLFCKKISPTRICL